MSLPEYIYGGETTEFEKVWDERTVRALVSERDRLAELAADHFQTVQTLMQLNACLVSERDALAGENAQLNALVAENLQGMQALAVRVRELERDANRWEMLAYMHTRGVTFHVYEHYIGNPERLDFAATLHREYLAGELARAESKP